MKKRTLAKITVLLVVAALISGCWDRRELEDQAFVQALGIDLAPHNQLLITFRIAIPGKSGLGQTAGGGGGGKGSIAAEASLLTSVIAPTIPAAITLASGYVNREINLMHTKAILFGEPFARQGVGPIMSILSRYRELRRNIFVGVSKGEAYELLQNNAPDLEKSYAKWWEGVKMMESREAIHPGTILQEFITDTETLGKEGTMIYLATNDNADSNDPTKIRIPPSFVRGDLGVRAGEIPRTGGNPVEYVGAAVFRKDKMVDVLNLSEAMSLETLAGTFRRTLYTVPDPLVKGRYIPLEIKQGSPPKINVRVDSDPIIIEEKISLEGDLVAIQSPIEYAADLRQQKTLEQVIARDIEQRSMELLKKMQKNNADIVGYGDYARRKLLTWQDWQDFNWPDKFSQAQIKIDVDFSIRRTGMQGKQAQVWMKTE